MTLIKLCNAEMFTYKINKWCMSIRLDTLVDMINHLKLLDNEKIKQTFSNTNYVLYKSEK